MQDSSAFQYIAIDQHSRIHHQPPPDLRAIEAGGACRVHPAARPHSAHHRSSRTQTASRSLQVRGASARHSLPNCSHSPPASWNSTMPQRWNGSWSRTRSVWTFTPTKRRKAFSVS